MESFIFVLVFVVTISSGLFLEYDLEEKKKKKNMTTSYHKMENHTLCTKYYSNITSEDECKKAAHKLDLKYGKSFTGPTDFPGCLFADDGREKVFFNLSPDADNSRNNKNYTALCKNSKSTDTGTPLSVYYCTGSYQEPASKAGNDKARPPPGTACVKHKGEFCQKEKGRWGSSFCKVAGGNWGAECVVCSGNSSSGNSSSQLPVLKFERKWSTQLKDSSEVSMQILNETLVVLGSKIKIFNLKGKNMMKGGYVPFYKFPRDLLLFGNPKKPTIVLSAMTVVKDIWEPTAKGLLFQIGTGTCALGFHKEVTRLLEPAGMAWVPGSKQVVIPGILQQQQVLIADHEGNKTVVMKAPNLMLDMLDGNTTGNPVGPKMETSWSKDNKSKGFDLVINVPYPDRVAASPVNDSKTKYVIASDACCDNFTSMNGVRLYDKNGTLLKTITALPPIPNGHKLYRIQEVAVDPKGNILVVEQKASKETGTEIVDGAEVDGAEVDGAEVDGAYFDETETDGTEDPEVETYKGKDDKGKDDKGKDEPDLDELFTTYIFDPNGNYIGEIKEFGGPKKIIFHGGKVYTLKRNWKEKKFYVNVFSYTN